MKLTEPKNFKDILELQAILDSKINSKRERTLEDIKLSLIAELIEFNEETKDSHKTWKTKSYNKEKELEELTDVYFFFAQLVNFKKIDKRFRLNMFIEAFEDFLIYNINYQISNLIKYITDDLYLLFFRGLLSLTQKHRYSKQNILNCYWSKWQKNMSRIGKEWN